MHEEHDEANERIGRREEERSERAFDDAITALLDGPDGDGGGDATDPGHAIDPQLADHVRTIAVSLRAVDPTPPGLIDAHVGAALDAWDALASEQTARGTSPTPVPIGLHSRRRSVRRAPRPRSFSPMSAWLGTAAALVLVVAGAAVVVDRSGGGGSDDVDAGPAAVEPSVEAWPEVFAFDAGEAETDMAREMAADDADMALDASGADTAWQADGGNRADGDPEVGDRATELPGNPTLGSLGPPWVGVIDPARLDVLVVELLPGVPSADDTACDDALDHLVAEGVLDDRPVLIGVLGADAVALDMANCEVLARASIPEDHRR